MSKNDNIKHKCCECGKTAVWYNEYNNSRKTKYYCDDCVPRGAICNVDNLEDMGEPSPNRKVMWWDKYSLTYNLLRNGSLTRDKDSFYYEELDEFGRRSPSDDFIYQPNGFSKKDEEKYYTVCYDDILEAVENSSKELTLDDEFDLSDVLGEIFIRYRNQHDCYSIEYKTLMSKFGNYISSKTMGKQTKRYDSWRRFYIMFKKQLNEVKVLH